MKTLKSIARILIKLAIQFDTFMAPYGASAAVSIHGSRTTK